MELQEFVKKSIEAVKSALGSSIPDHRDVDVEIEIALDADGTVLAVPSPDPAGRVKFKVSIANDKPSPRIG